MDKSTFKKKMCNCQKKNNIISKTFQSVSNSESSIKITPPHENNNHTLIYIIISASFFLLIIIILGFYLYRQHKKTISFIQNNKRKQE